MDVNSKHMRVVIIIMLLLLYNQNINILLA